MTRPSRASQSPSLQDLIRLRKAAAFVGRERELLLFDKNLSVDLAEDARWFLVHLHGPAGVGKTSLVQRWMSAVEGRGGLVAYVDQGPGDVVDALAAVSEQLSTHGKPLKDFGKQLAAYRERRNAADTALTGTGSGASPSMAGTLAAQAGPGVLDLVMPGAGQFASRVLPPEQLAQNIDGLREALTGRLRAAQYDGLPSDPALALTPAFLRDLSTVARGVPFVALFFDSYEHTGPFLDSWLRDVIVGERYGTLAANTILCVSGQRAPDRLAWTGFEHFATEVALQPFSETEARQALVARGTTDEDTVRTVLDLSGGLPVLLSMLAATGPVSPQDVSDPTSEAVDLFLRQVTDPHRRRAALVGALPVQLDEDVLRVALGDAESTLEAPYEWLCDLPFVHDCAGRAHYHEVVRAAMVRVQRHRSPQQWRSAHLRLAEHFAARARTECKETVTRNDLVVEPWHDQHWRELRRQETYHRLCADPADALPQALRGMACILNYGSSTIRHWAQTLEQASVDCGREHASLAGWAVRLGTVADGEAPLSQMCDILLTAPEHDKCARAFLLAVRGHDADRRGDLPAALHDLDRALEINPGCADALHWRAQARLSDHQYEGALSDAGELLAHMPHHYDLLHISITARLALQDYEGVVEGTTALLERAPDDYDGLTVRAHALIALLRYREALDTWDRLSRIAPENPEPLVERGRMHYMLHRHEQALEDFDRAARRGADSLKLLHYRACVYRELGRFDESLSCLDAARARESATEAATGVTTLITAKTYHYMGRTKDGLALLERFVAAHPDNVRMLTALTTRLASSGRDADAVTFATRLVVLAPEDGNAHLAKARAHAGLGQLRQAQSGLERAVELSPALSAAHDELAAVLAHGGAWQAAVNHWTTALELQPEDAAVYTQRAYIRILLGDYEAALQDLDAALSLSSGENAVFPHGLRARCHRLLGEHTKAQRDLDRLIPSGFTLLERALLWSRMHGQARAVHAWNRVSAQTIWSDRQSGRTDDIARLLAAAARTDWIMADNLASRLIAPSVLPVPAEPPSLFGERGRHQLVEAVRDLRFLGEGTGTTAQLERLAARLESAVCM
ncbi:tetratricopeptide repeat protein [Streptomyces phaeochromogenes]|uniref:ATP-binding protein n=1 Tax=Streptomyces phaeochromogenes TaxID=1923 RepID=UPI00340E4D17